MQQLSQQPQPVSQNSQFQTQFPNLPLFTFPDQQSSQQQSSNPQSSQAKNPPIVQTNPYSLTFSYIFTCQFPRLDDYSDIQKIRDTFAPLKDINLESNAQLNLSNAIFVIMKSANEDNIHKGLKYGVWTSSMKNNEELNKIWEQAVANKQEVYLIFSVYNQKRICAIGKLASGFLPKESFRYWQDDFKWFGSFKVNWVYVNDIEDQKFANIKEPTDNSDNAKSSGDQSTQTPQSQQQQQSSQQQQYYGKQKCVTDFKDCTQISNESGVQIMKIFQTTPYKQSIFNQFKIMDQRENQMREYKDKNQQWIAQYESKCKEFAKDPANFQANNQAKERKYKYQQKKNKGNIMTQNKQYSYPSYKNKPYQSYIPQKQHQYIHGNQYQQPMQYMYYIPNQNYIPSNNFNGINNLNFNCGIGNNSLNHQPNLLNPIPPNQIQNPMQIAPQFLLQQNPLANLLPTGQQNGVQPPIINPQIQNPAAILQQTNSLKINYQPQIFQAPSEQQQQSQQGGKQDQQEYNKYNNNSKSYHSDNNQDKYQDMALEEKFTILTLEDRKKNKKKKNKQQQQQQEEGEDSNTKKSDAKPDTEKEQKEQKDEKPQEK